MAFFDKTSKGEIESSKHLFIEMKREAEKYEKLSSLAYSDWAETIKHNISYNICFGLKKAASYFYHNRNGTPYEDDEKSHFEFVEEEIKNIIGTSVQILEINNNLSTDWGFEIRFKVPEIDKIEFTLNIPVIESLDKNNLSKQDFGKLRLGYFKDSITNDIIRSSYEESDIKRAFIEFLNEQE